MFSLLARTLNSRGNKVANNSVRILAKIKFSRTFPNLQYVASDSVTRELKLIILPVSVVREGL